MPNNDWSAGERIMPMAEDAARKWADEHIADNYANFYNYVDDERAQFAIDVPKSVLAAIDERKAADKCSRSEVIIKALQAYL